MREEQAREKTKIRKDYDLMSTQLADLLKDEELTKRILHVSADLNFAFRFKRLIQTLYQFKRSQMRFCRRNDCSKSKKSVRN